MTLILSYFDTSTSLGYHPYQIISQSRFHQHEQYSLPTHPTPRLSPNLHPELTGISAEPSHTTSTISPINPDGQPRTDASNEALGCAGFGEKTISPLRSSVILMNMRSVICPI